MPRRRLRWLKDGEGGELRKIMEEVLKGTVVANYYEFAWNLMYSGYNLSSFVHTVKIFKPNRIKPSFYKKRLLRQTTRQKFME